MFLLRNVVLGIAFSAALNLTAYAADNSSTEDFQQVVPQTDLQIERPIPNSYATRNLLTPRFALIPITPDHARSFYSVYDNAQAMRYYGEGSTYSSEVVERFFERHARQNLSSTSGKFFWAIVTHTGVAGRIYISFDAEGNRLEVAFLVLPTHAGRSLARLAANLVVNAHDDKTDWIATVHPSNIASQVTLEGIQRADGTALLQRDPARQNHPSTYGPNQARDYFVSGVMPAIQWWSFYSSAMHTLSVE